MIDLDEDEPLPRQRRSWKLQVVDVLLAAIAVGFVAVVVNVVLRFFWTPRQVEVDGGVALYYPWNAIWVIAGIGVVVVVAGLRLGMDRQYYNWLIVATGVALMTFGTSFAARERVVIGEEEFRVRRWWGLQSHAWRYDDLNSISIVEHRGNRASRWTRVHCEVKGENGAATIEEVGAPTLLGPVQIKLFTHAQAMGVVVGWTIEWRR
jgi:hypothetical protein